MYATPYLLHNAHPSWTFVNATCTGAKTGDILFRDVVPPFIGHAVCDGGSGSSTEWINGLSNPVDESYHPKTTGQANGYYPVVHVVTG